MPSAVESDVAIEVTTEQPRDLRILGPVDEAALTRSPPDAFVFARRKADIHAHVALYWSKTPLLDGRPTGFLGHFAARSLDAIEPLLSSACEILRVRRVGIAIGPVNGNTWEKYRFVTWSDGSPSFFLEPESPPEWPAAWENAGFSVLARYNSTERRNLDEYAEYGQRHLPKLKARGVRVLGVTPDDFEVTLRRVYPLVREAFARNFLYKPLELDEFLALYRPAAALVDPRFCRVVEMDGEIIAFVFAYVDPIERARTGRPGTVVVKTLAARASMRTAFAGALLAIEIDLAAKEIGAERVVNALMHESSRSLKMAARFGSVLRRYALYARALSG